MLIAGTAAFLAYNFWRGSAPYGDPATAVEEKNYCLAAYAGVAGFFPLFECISFLWAMTRVRVRDGRKTYKEDTGRRLSFIFIYVCSYASFWINQIIPQSPDVLKGIRGALDVFGSMHNALLGLCLAGVISCLVRSMQNRLRTTKRRRGYNIFIFGSVFVLLFTIILPALRTAVYP